MKAIVLERFGGIDQFKSSEVAKPLPKRDEVRIRIKAVGFNPVDCKMREGLYQNTFPLILGVDCSGIIDAVGEEFHEFSVGDEVLALVFGQGSNGTYAEYTCVPKQFVVKKPENMSFATAAGFPLAALTAFRALIFSGALNEGESLFVAGATGGVGSILLKLAKLYKAGPIFTTAGSQQSAEHLIAHHHIPIKHILFYKSLTVNEMKERLLQMNQGQLFATCIDLVGGKMKELCFAVSGYSGHIATILPEGKNFPIDLWTRNESSAFQKSLSVHFIAVGAESFSGQSKSWNIYKQQLGFLVDLVRKGELLIETPEIIGNFSLETVQSAHLRLESQHTRGKLIMSF